MARTTEFTGACKVICGHGGKGKFAVYLPDRLLWSPEGMAELFRMARRWLADPKDFPKDTKVEDAWEFFHIVAIKPCHKKMILDIAWEEPEELEERRAAAMNRDPEEEPPAEEPAETH